MSETCTVTIGADGRMYFHELTPEILAVAAEVCPENTDIQERLALLRLLSSPDHEHSTESVEQNTQR